jgi:hypothetical protein
LSQAAFALRAEFDADTFAGSTSLPDGTVYNVGEALSEGKGTIVTDDETVVTVLDAYPALKRTTVPKQAPSKSTPSQASSSGTSGAGNASGSNGGDS